jgi:hypothetical protein
VANLISYFNKWPIKLPNLQKGSGFSNFLEKKFFGQVVLLVHWRDFHLCDAKSIHETTIHNHKILKARFEYSPLKPQSKTLTI